MRERHGESLLQLHKVWRSMRQRCLTKTHNQYMDYGGRGITICDEWLESYISFAAWARTNGYKSWKLLDRRDNNGNYSPENCRWVTEDISMKNRRNTLLITAFGETKTVKEWTDDARCKIGYHGLRYRILKGMKSETAIILSALK